MYADSQIIRLGIPAMARRRYAFDEGKIARFQKEGRGRGTSYKPWLTIQDVASHGRSHRIAGIKTGRVHHFLSDIERDAFYQFDWADTVTDIREHYRGAKGDLVSSVKVRPLMKCLYCWPFASNENQHSSWLLR